MISSSEFFQSYETRMVPFRISEKEFRDWPEPFYVRSLPNSNNSKDTNKKIFVQFSDGLIFVTNSQGDLFPLSRIIKNEIGTIFKDHMLILTNRIMEISIDTLGKIFIQDLFNLDQSFQEDVAKRRFSLLLKLFRETKSSKYFEFNLPRLQFSKVLLENDLNEIQSKNDLFPYSSYNSCKIQAEKD